MAELAGSAGRVKTMNEQLTKARDCAQFAADDLRAALTGDASAKAGGWADMENSAWWYAEWLKLARRSLKQDGFACVFGNWRYSVVEKLRHLVLNLDEFTVAK